MRRMLDGLAHDVRHAVRAARARPGVSLVVVVSLALALGANALLYSVVDATIVRPLPFPDLERLVGVGAAYPRLNEPLEYFEVLSAPEYLDIKSGVSSFGAAAGFDLGNEHVLANDVPERVFTAYFWDDPFPVLGITPAAGRSFTAEEIASGARLAVISNAFWHSRFGGASRALGAPLRISGQAFTVIGIMPAHASVYNTDLWIPMSEPAARLARNRRQFNVIARVRSDRTLAQVNAELASLATNIQATHGSGFPEYRDWQLEATQWTRIQGSGFSSTRLITFGALALLLILVCVNLATLTLARATARRQEMAIRTALGSGRRRLVRQMIVESLFLAGLGGTLGLGIAVVGVRALPGVLPSSIVPANALYRLDWRLVAFCAGISLLAGLIVAIAPAFQASRTDIRDILTGESTSILSPPRGRWLRQILVSSEAALAVIVVAAAALLASVIGRLLLVEPGFNVDGLVAMRLTLPGQRYDGDARTVFFEELMEQARTLPGVTHATVGLQYPPSVFSTSQFEIEGSTPRSDGTLPSAFHTVAGATYLQTLGIPLREGRWLDDRATMSAPLEVVINEAAARRYFGDKGALGRRIRIIGQGSDGRWGEIVGIAADVRNRGIVSQPGPEMFTSLRQAPERRRTQLFLVIRATTPSAGIVSAVRQIVRRMDPEQPVYGVSTIAGGFQAGLATRRATASLLNWSAGLALGLAALGIYGMLSHSVTERRREIGLRMALGASRRQVSALVVRQAVVPALAGIAIGTVAIYAFSKTLASWVYGVSPEPMILALVAVAVLLLSIAAAVLPARRAVGIPVVEGLRS
jgi:predicted permease